MMKRLLVTVAAIVLLAALIATVRLVSQPHKSSADDGEAPLAASSDAVQVRHEFVTLPDPAAAPLLDHRPSTPPTTPVSAPRLQRVRAGDDALLSKARRAILGDGRHRPEPFPRIK